jgi:hypothetical protein
MDETRGNSSQGSPLAGGLPDSGSEGGQNATKKPSWPIPAPDVLTDPPPPPVGLNWGTVSQQLGLDLQVLKHDGRIMVAGEFVPEGGVVIDPHTFRALRAHIGSRVFGHAYFVGELTLDEHRLQLPVEGNLPQDANVIVRAEGGAVIGIFADGQQATRAKRQIIRGSIGAGVTLEQGPLGMELRVARSDAAGRVATVIASQGGAVISIGGERV